MTDGRLDTIDHIASVRININAVIENLCDRKTAHDASKLEEPELSGYAEMPEAFKGKAYGSPEYMAVIALFKPIVDHHYAHNRHHPEHWPNGISDMSLLDIIEMLADWRAANDRHGGDFAKSLVVSIARFHFDDDRIGEILMNTARELRWI